MQRYVNPEIGRFEIDDLLYQVCFYKHGEIRFWVTGDNIRLGILTEEDLKWDCTFNLPAIDSTDEVVNIHSHSLHVMRRVMRLYAQYLSKHQPYFFYYLMPRDPRVERVFLKLAQRNERLCQLYDIASDKFKGHVMFTRASNESDQFD